MSRIKLKKIAQLNKMEQARITSPNRHIRKGHRLQDADLLARIKNLVHECTNSTSLETLEKDLELTLTKFESNVGEGNTRSGLTISAPQKRPTQQRKGKIAEHEVQSVSLKRQKVQKSKTLPPVRPKKVHPFSKQSGQHAEMMRKHYKTTMSLEEMNETQADTSSSCQTPGNFQNVSYTNFTPTIRKRSPLTTTILRNGPHSLSLLQLKSLEPILPRGTVILLKSISKEFKPGWVYDEVVNSFLWFLQKNKKTVLYAPSTSMLALQKGLPCGRLWEGDDITSKDFIFAPWNPTDYHWTLVAIDMKRKQILYLDPLANVDANQNVFARMLSTFMPQKLERTFGLSGFQICSLPHTLQTDSNSCGVLVCWYAMQLINGKSLTDPCNTSLMRVTIYKQIRGTCLQRPSGCGHIELYKCPICKGEVQNGNTRFECRRCYQSYHTECLTADQKSHFYCPPMYVH